MVVTRRHSRWRSRQGLCLVSGLTTFLDKPEVRVLLNHRFELGENVPGCNDKTVCSRTGLLPLPSGQIEAITASEVPALTSEPGCELAAFDPPGLSLIEVPAQVLIASDSVFP
jgi:hypothetical protein